MPLTEFGAAGRAIYNRPSVERLVSFDQKHDVRVGQAQRVRREAIRDSDRFVALSMSCEFVSYGWNAAF